MKKAFKIFKQGTTTSGPIWIKYPSNEAYDIPKKVKFYEGFGYTVTDIQN